MPVKRPYYGLHQIVTGQYTNGGEFVTEAGENYVGSYHILPTGQRFTEFRPKDASFEIFERRVEVTDDVLLYNRLTRRRTNQHVSPVSMAPSPLPQQYKKGIMERFFVQKRNSPLNTITEIDAEQYNQINTRNNPGINGILWNKLKLVWRISLIPPEDAHYLNQQLLQRAEHDFPGIGIFLPNPLEFYR
jgi:hypothetical protein